MLLAIRNSNKNRRLVGTPPVVMEKTRAPALGGRGWVRAQGQVTSMSYATRHNGMFSGSLNPSLPGAWVPAHFSAGPVNSRR